MKLQVTKHLQLLESTGDTGSDRIRKDSLYAHANSANDAACVMRNDRVNTPSRICQLVKPWFVCKRNNTNGSKAFSSPGTLLPILCYCRWNSNEKNIRRFKFCDLFYECYLLRLTVFKMTWFVMILLSFFLNLVLQRFSCENFTIVNWHRTSSSFCRASDFHMPLAQGQVLAKIFVKPCLHINYFI